MIEDFTKTIKKFEDYTKDLKTQSAVERQLGIIGEAVNNYEDLNTETPLTHTRKIVGFRNRLIHAYDAVDASMVWAIIINFLPPLKEEVVALLKQK